MVDLRFYEPLVAYRDMVAQKVAAKAATAKGN